MPRVCRMHGRGEGRHQLGGLAGRLRRSGQLVGQAAALDVLHRKVRPAVTVAHVINLDDVWVPQPGHCLCLALKPCPFVRGGVGAGASSDETRRNGFFEMKSLLDSRPRIAA
jgi:hypothetical protein